MLFPPSRRWPARTALAAWLCAAAAAHAAPPSAALPDTLTKIQAAKSITIGLRNSAPPFASVDAAGKPQGFTWELCKAIVKSLSDELKTPLETKVVPVALAESFDMLQDGRIDLQCGSTTHTVEREQKVAFSNTFFISGIVVAYRKGEMQYASPKEFGRVGVLAGSTAEKAVQARVKNTKDVNFKSVTPFTTYEEGQKLLKTGQIDTLAADGQLMPADPAIDLRRQPLTVEPYALMMRKGDTRFVQAVDRALASHLQSPAARQWASNAGLKVNFMTSDAWLRPNKEPAAPQF